MDNADNKGLPTGGVAAPRRGLRNPAGGGIRREKIEAAISKVDTASTSPQSAAMHHGRRRDDRRPWVHHWHLSAD
jgi:hypothetical protein